MTNKIESGPIINHFSRLIYGLENQADKRLHAMSTFIKPDVFAYARPPGVDLCKAGMVSPDSSGLTICGFGSRLYFLSVINKIFTYFNCKF